MTATPLMQWAAWMQASDDEFFLEGYEPNEKARQKRERAKRLKIQDNLQYNIQP
ncbi:hypothetical protein [Candidatus Coxiella mudrowiae]|uniref:hypothetical protein n=1 Tax=Candidatus Coxiella mudrowiae TaxID=2054173 RepID=UPI0027D26F60|nr:hypothetical protein [Candidatus Coxiella mudrowiae]